MWAGSRRDANDGQEGTGENSVKHDAKPRKLYWMMPRNGEDYCYERYEGGAPSLIKDCKVTTNWVMNGYQTQCENEKKNVRISYRGVIVEQSLLRTEKKDRGVFILMKSWRSQKAGAASVLVQWLSQKR